MAAKKRITQVKKASQTRVLKKRAVASSSNLASRFSESYTSLIIGAVVVIVLAIVLIAFIRGQNVQNNTEQATSSTNTESEEIKTYIVQSGDDLWSIAESEYDNGYEWTTIAEENNITDPNVIVEGSTLVIPSKSLSQVSDSTVQVDTSITPDASLTAVPQSDGDQITSESYVVHAGESLWDIAIRAYGDGYKWVDIARVNSLSNPDVIHTGNTLTLPRS